MTVRSFVAGLAFIAAIAADGASQARAADLPLPAPAPMAPVASATAAIYDWSGFYIGGHGGGASANLSWSDPLGSTNNTFGKAGFLGGAQAGGNLQFNRLVLGVEGDFSWSGLKGAGSDSIGNGIGTDLEWTSTVTGRVGAAFDRLLVYGKGGVAFAQDRNTFTDLLGNVATISQMRTGWTAGAGLEYGLSKNWSARIEYDYLGFGSRTLSFTTATTPVYAAGVSTGVQEIKAGVNFRFGP